MPTSKEGLFKGSPAVQHGRRLHQTQSPKGNRCLTATTQHAGRDDEDDDLSLPTVDGLTDTAADLRSSTRLTMSCSHNVRGQHGRRRAVTALEDAIRRESSDTLRSRLVATRALILDLPLAD